MSASYKTWLVCYTTASYYPSAVRLCLSARRHGIDHVQICTPKDLSGDFKAKHANILRHKRGAGYWLWKPHVIAQTMQQASEGDIIIYSDSSVQILHSLQPLIDIALQNEIVLFSVANHIQREWTKRDAFILLDADAQAYWDDACLLAGFQVYKNTERARTFVNEWLLAMSDERALTDMPNQLGQPNLPEFKEHRHDQAVLGILRTRHRLEVFRDISQYGNTAKRANPLYPQLVLVHRKQYRGIKAWRIPLSQLFWCVYSQVNKSHAK